MIPSDCIVFRKEFIPKIQNGTKTMTTRRDRYEPGLYRTVPGLIWILILDVRLETLAVIAERFWKEEGAESPKDFIRIWKAIHRGNWNPGSLRWLHRFELGRRT